MNGVSWVALFLVIQKTKLLLRVHRLTAPSHRSILPEPVQNLFVGGFSLSIGLRPSDGHEPCLNAIHGTIMLYLVDVELLVGIELLVAVKDHCLWHFKPHKDILAYELSDFLFSDGCYCFYFQPLSKIDRNMSTQNSIGG